MLKILEKFKIEELTLILGDLEQLVSPDPVVTCIERDEQDNYLLVACDGIYDFLSNQEIIEYINERFTSEEHEKDIVSNLIDLALHKVSQEYLLLVVKSRNLELERQYVRCNSFTR